MRLLQRIFGILALVAMLFAVPKAAVADKRVALIIGNSAYQHGSALANPARDARAMAAMFQTAGFDVVRVEYDVGNLQFRRLIREFENATADSDISVVYYSGYGIDIDGINYLIPVDAKLASDLDAADEIIPLERLTEATDGAKRLRLVILDACRETPFARTMLRQGRASTHAVEPTLGAFEVTTSNTLMAYAAKSGSTALDGNSDHSPFTSALLANLFVPGLDIRLAFGRVRDQVLKSTDNRQQPFVYGSLGSGHIALVSLPPQPAAVTDDIEKTKADYALINKVDTKGAWEVFLSQHPTGFYSDLARQRIAMLNSSQPQPSTPSQVATVADPLPPPAPRQPSTEEQRAWDKIKDSSNASDFRDFIQKYPTSVLANVARSHIDAIERAAQAAARAAAQQAEQAADRARLQSDGAKQHPDAEAKQAPQTAPAAAPSAKPELADKTPSPLPNFPWPPPAASASYVLPQSLFGGQSTVGDETNAIIAALERNGYVERSFYGTPADGVALITRLERINNDGSPAAAAMRWPAGEYQADAINLAQFLRGLFFADPGRYRVIVFIIQNQPFTQATGKAFSGEQAEALLPSGANVLPAEVAERSVAESHCTALIYEFANDGTAMRKVQSHLTGKQHLEKSGLLAVLEKPN
jgi:hypothetical protein